MPTIPGRGDERSCLGSVRVEPDWWELHREDEDVVGLVGELLLCGRDL